MHAIRLVGAVLVTSRSPGLSWLFHLLYRCCLLEWLLVIINQTIAAANDFIYLTL